MGERAHVPGNVLLRGSISAFIAPQPMSGVRRGGGEQDGVIINAIDTQLINKHTERSGARMCVQYGRTAEVCALVSDVSDEPREFFFARLTSMH